MKPCGSQQYAGLQLPALKAQRGTLPAALQSPAASWQPCVATDGMLWMRRGYLFTCSTPLLVGGKQNAAILQPCALWV